MRAHRLAAAALATFTIASPLAAQEDDPGLEVSTERMQADMDTMVGFGTRHTLSSQTDPERGIGAAVEWALAEFGRIGDQCGGCLDVLPVERVIEAGNRRIPVDTLVRNTVAIQRGTERPNEVILVQGHYDSRVSDGLDGTTDAPGANDNASASVMILEAARILSQREYPSTIIYALLSGEEVGLYGAQIMGDWLKDQDFTVKAVLNNDMIGNSCGSDGYCEPDFVRVFSEGLRADSTEQLRAQQRRFGGENESPGRNISRWLQGFAARYPDGMQVRQIWRTDRAGRGGDQIPILDRGFPAIRIMVAVEDYEHQHQDTRVENGIKYGDTVDELDWTYLTRSSVLNIRALDALASAPMPPAISANGIVRTDTAIAITKVPGATSYNVYARRTDQPNWSDPIETIEIDDQGDGFMDQPITFTVNLRGDDWLFGASACTFDACSPVSSAVPGGQFAPIAQPEGDE